MAAESNVPIDRLDKENGIIISKTVYLAPSDTLADCGPGMRGPTQATWNVLVTGDSASSFVRMNVAYERIGPSRKFLDRAAGAVVAENCSTSGRAEASIEQTIRTRAEKAP